MPLYVAAHPDLHCLPMNICLRGVGDKPMSCKPGVAGSFPGYSIKTLLVEPSGVPVIK